MKQEIPTNIQTALDLAIHFNGQTVPEGFKWISNYNGDHLDLHHPLDAGTLKRNFAESDSDFLFGPPKGCDTLTEDDLDFSQRFLQVSGSATLLEPTEFDPSSALVQNGFLGVYKGPKQSLDA